MNTYAQAYTEVLEIIKHLPQDEVDKIPKETIDFFDKNKDTNYSFEISDYNNISNNNISRKTYAIIVDLGKKYLFNEEEKAVLDQMLNKNELEIEERKKELYDSKNMFSNSNNEVDTKNINKVEKVEEHSLVVVENKSFIKKIVDKIKSFFRLGDDH